MPQIFHPAFNAVARATIFGFLLALGGTVYAGARLYRSSYATGVDLPLEQPVQFSHRHHVQALGIDCRYCHGAVEIGPNAGMPPTKTCMNCHSQIWADSPALEPVRRSWREQTPIRWTRVHDLADFAYFDHHIHLARGIGCSSCHGRVDDMPLVRKDQPLLMSWCLDCHRNPEPHWRPAERLFDADAAPGDARPPAPLKRRTDCGSCHR
jgi:hypothetical protein